MKKKQKKVIYVNKGLANCYEDHIEINKNLKKDKILRDYVIKHELGHKDSFDLFYEFKSINLKIMPRLLRFIKNNPSTWIDFLPIQYKNKQLIYDTNLIILYLIIISTLFLLVF
ncbi:MAG: hypothetical protein ACFFHD_05655 [Promethearchaeota archaeon]